MTITELLVEFPIHLSQRTSHHARDRELLLSHVLGVERAWLLAHEDAAVHPSRAARFRRLDARLAQGEPLAYLTGERWFFGRAFHVTPNLLIPRPETELLVELTLRAFRSERLTPDVRRLVDLGTGSGCIAVTLAAELPNARVIAIDVSPTALRVARTNARRLGVVDRIDFLRGDLLVPILRHPELIIPPSSFCICANLPYLTTAEWRALPRSIRAHEPRLALDGGRDGLACFRTLFSQLSALVAYGCRLTAFLEVDPRRTPSLTRLAHTMCPSFTANWHRDLAGRCRVLELRTPAPRSPFPPTSSPVRG